MKEPVDLNAPRYKIRHVDKPYYFPLYVSEVESVETIILMGLQRITRRTPESAAVAAGWMLFTKDFLNISTIKELERLPQGAELVLSPVEVVIVRDEK